MAIQAAILVVFFINVVFSAPITDDLIVTLPDGKIQGAEYVSRNNLHYYGFRGIPFAAPPVGDLRLELPQPPQYWSGILNATQDSKDCVTYHYFEQPDVESEDCLYVNVYVPKLQSKEKLSVMFWVYGGSFIEGSAVKSFYGPDFIVEENVILVTFNYRVGPFGFISTADEALPGNLGMHDQSLALKWTYKNIEYFGGDPKKITIFGESAGGAAIGLHLISKQSAGLFRAAIVQSGGALIYWVIDRNPRTTAYLIADKIPGGTYGNDTQALKAFLKSKSVEEITRATNSLPTGVQVSPVLEKESENAFIGESIYELLANGDYNQVPIVIGICAQEALFFLKDVDTATAAALAVDNEKNKVIPIGLNPDASKEDELVEKIRNLYLKDGEKFSTNLLAFANYYTDNEYSRGVIKQAELTALTNPVYLYQFAYYGRPITNPFIPGSEKASHGAEIPFLFNMTRVSQTTDPQDLLVQKQIATLWTNFAKYLNPTPTKSDLFNNVIWPLFDQQNSYLNINNTLEVRQNLKGNTYSKWDDIYQTYGRKPIVTY